MKQVAVATRSPEKELARRMRRARGWLKASGIDPRRDSVDTMFAKLLATAVGVRPPAVRALPRARRGAPVKWTAQMEHELLMGIYIHTRFGGKTVLAACRALLNQDPWRVWSTGVGRERKLTANTLRDRYSSIVRRTKNWDPRTIFSRIAWPFPGDLPS